MRCGKMLLVVFYWRSMWLEKIFGMEWEIIHTKIIGVAFDYQSFTLQRFFMLHDVLILIGNLPSTLVK